MSLKQRIYLFLGAGIASGFFIGGAIGLARSPIIGAAITALVPVAVIVFTGKYAKDEKIDKNLLEGSVTFTLGFFLAATIGLSVGMTIRTSDSEIKSMYHDLIAIGVSEKDARDEIVLLITKGIPLSSITSPWGMYSARSSSGSDSGKNGDLTEICKRFGKPPWKKEDLESMRLSGNGEWQDAAAIIMLFEKNCSKTDNLLEQVQLKLFRLLCPE